MQSGDICIRLDGPGIGVGHEISSRAVIGPEVVGQSCRSFIVTTWVNGSQRERYFHIGHAESDDGIMEASVTIGAD